MCHAAKHSWPEEFDVQLSDPFKGHVNALFVLLMSDLSFRPPVTWRCARASVKGAAC